MSDQPSSKEMSNPNAETWEECVRLRAEVAKLERDLEKAMTERDEAEDALQTAHVALGGDGEWAGKLPPENPPDSGDLRLDVPTLAAQRMEELETLKTLEGAARRAFINTAIRAAHEPCERQHLPLMFHHGPFCEPPDEVGARGSCCCNGQQDALNQWASLPYEVARLSRLLETNLDGQEGIHVSTGAESRDAKLFSARDVQAFTAIGFALRKKHEADRAAQPPLPETAPALQPDCPHCDGFVVDGHLLHSPKCRTLTP